jgi:hypothetical protein
MLINNPNNCKITAKFLGGLDYFVSKQASKQEYYYIIGSRERDSRTDFPIIPSWNEQLLVP